MKTYFLLFLFLLAFQVCSAQSEIRDWYFGSGAGVSFDPNTGVATALTDGSINTLEGCATISDANGNFLFSTNGSFAYNANQQIMQNGAGLRGNSSSTQSAIVVPKPGSTDIYYIFTVDVPLNAGGGAGLSYYEVDMTLDNGLGAVTTNIQNPPNLIPNTSEKVTAIAKSGTNNFWVISYANSSGVGQSYDTFYAFEITDTGVSTTPVTSTFQGNPSNSDPRGYLKVSPDGRYLVNANVTNGVALYDFDAASGIVSNERSLTMEAGQFGYGIGFSPNGNYLYISSSNDLPGSNPTNHQSAIYQFDLTAANVDQSRTTVWNGQAYRGALQLALNGKIYHARAESFTVGLPFLGVINNPDLPAANTNYDPNGINLNGRQSMQGLPTFVQSFFDFDGNQPITFQDPLVETFVLNNPTVGVSSPSSNADTNNDGVITVREARAVSFLDLGQLDIATAADLQHFPNLIRFGVDSNQLTAIDFSDNPQLADITLRGAQLNNITLGTLPDLEYLEMGAFMGTIPNLDNYPALEYLILEDFQVSSFDTSSLTQLKTLILDNLANLQSLDVSPLVDLQIFQLHNLDQLISFNAAVHPMIEDIIFENLSAVQTLDFNGFAEAYIEIKDNDNLESINVLNGSTFILSGYEIENNPRLELVCVDFNELVYDSIINDPSAMNGQLNSQGGHVSVNDYCNISPPFGYSKIEGSVSYDSQGNCSSSSSPVPDIRVTVDDGTDEIGYFSNASGEYGAYVQDGSYTVSLEYDPFYHSANGPFNVSFPSSNSPFTADFCMSEPAPINDLEIMVSSRDLPRPGFDVSYQVRAYNKGNQTNNNITASLTFEDSLMDYLGSTGNGTLNGSQINWTIATLAPFQTETYTVDFNLNTPTDNPSLNSGDILTYNAALSYPGTDETPSDNTFDLTQTVVNSYDPNDITCLQGEQIEPTQVGEYVHYRIRFENEGTASAVNVVVKNVIDDTKFDLTSFQPLGGSHDYFTRVREGNIVEFIFEDINLDFNDATNDGYILYKIKTRNTLVEGDSFDNSAEIYFDFNPPINTNTYVTNVMATASTRDVQDRTVALYPNPAGSQVQIRSDNRIQSLQLFDLQGRRVISECYQDGDSQQSLVLEGIGSGVYFLKAETSIGVSTQKLIVR